MAINKKISDFIKGFIVTGLADYIAMYLILSHSIVKLTEATILTAILGGIFNALLNHFYRR